MDETREAIKIVTILKRLEKAMLRVPLSIDEWAKIFAIVCPEQFDEAQTKPQLKNPKKPRKETEQEKKKYIIALQRTSKIVDEISEARALEEC